MGEKMIITKDMIINDVIQKYPKTITVFSKFKVDSCCGGGVSIEKTAGMSGVDIDSLLQALNKAAVAECK
jgi:regulator of cell morphogenesis and NO signaling